MNLLQSEFNAGNIKTHAKTSKIISPWTINPFCSNIINLFNSMSDDVNDTSPSDTKEVR